MINDGIYCTVYACNHISVMNRYPRTVYIAIINHDYFVISLDFTGKMIVHDITVHNDNYQDYNPDSC